MVKLKNNLNIRKLFVLFIIMVLIIPINIKQVKAFSGYTLVPNGLYFIQNINKKVVDINGGSQKNGATAHLWELNKSGCQIFYFQRVNYNQFIITAYHSGKSLEVRNSSKNNCADIAQWDTHNGDCQRWKLVPTYKSGYYNIQNVNSNLYMDIDGNSKNNGANIQQFEGNNSNAQLFRLLSVENLKAVDDFFDSQTLQLDGIYKVKSVLGKYVDVKDGSQENGETVHLWQRENVNNQLFYIKTINGKCVIRAVHSNKVVEVRNSSHEVGADIAQWDDNNLDCQRWLIIPVKGNSVKIINVESNLCMDVKGGSKENGTNIQQYFNNETASQLFKLEKVN